MPQPDASHKPSFLLRPGEWALVLAIAVAIGLTALVDANHSYWFRPLESARDIALNTAMLGIFALAGLPAQLAFLCRGDFLATLFHRLGRYLATLDEFGETNFVVFGEQRVLANVCEV